MTTSPSERADCGPSISVVIPCHNAAAFLFDSPHRLCDIRTGFFFAVDAQQVAEQVDRMDAHQNRTGLCQVTFNKRQVFDRLNRGCVDVHREVAAKRACHRRCRQPPYKLIVLQAVGDEVFDGADFEVVLLGERHEIGHARHGAVIVHDFTNDG